MPRLLAGCVALAALSLVLPSQPSYDPWAWIVWGREIAFLDLDTTGGPSWKPLPVAFTLAFSPFGLLSDGLPPALWLVVARAGALLAMALAFRLARRLAGPNDLVGLGAGATAALALALSPGWLRYAAHGNEAPLAIGLMLWGVERHLDGVRSHALVLGFLACLLRPEAFPFLAAYGIWLWLVEPASRRLAAALALALPALWLVPEWIGSGDPFSAGQQARSEPSWSLSLADRPWLEALHRFHSIAGLPLELGALAAAGVAWWRRDRVTLALAGVAVLWVGLVAAMTQAGFSGNARYFLPAVVLACVLAGVGAAGLVGAAGRPAAGAAVMAALALAVAPHVGGRAGAVADQARSAERVAGLHRDLSAAVRGAGGRDSVVARGAPRVNRAFQTRLAWETGLTLGEVERGRGSGLVFSSTDPEAGQRVTVPRGSRSLTPGGRAGPWRVFAVAPQSVIAALKRGDVDVNGNGTFR